LKRSPFFPLGDKNEKEKRKEPGPLFIIEIEPRYDEKE